MANETGLRRTLALDWFERLLLTALYGWLLYRFFPDPGLPKEQFTTELILALPPIIGEGLLLVFIWIRRSSQKISQKPLEWLVAFGATCLPLAVQSSPGQSLLPPLLVVIVLFALFFLELYAKLSLGRSFGVVPANRGIQATGLYRFVRHPIYATYLLRHILILLVHPLLLNLLLYVAVYSVQIPRLLLEEKLLEQDPAYQDYKKKVRYRLIPGIF